MIVLVACGIEESYKDKTVKFVICCVSGGSVLKDTIYVLGICQTCHTVAKETHQQQQQVGPETFLLKAQSHFRFALDPGMYIFEELVDAEAHHTGKVGHGQWMRVSDF